MNRHPPQPPHARLDAEERALAELLPRPPGRSEPSAAMDARILAAGKADPQPQPARRQPRRNWIAPLSVAASLVLAVGLAWQLRPPPALVVHEQAADAAFPAPDAAAVRTIEMPPAAPSVPMPTTEARPVASMRAPAAPAAKPASSPPTAAQKPNANLADAGFAAPPPAAPPAPPAPVAVGEAAAAQVAAPPAIESARAAAPAMAKARASTPLRESSESSANTATQSANTVQRAATDAGTLADDPGEEVPPATADSPEVREAWLRRIGELLKQGKTEEATSSLDEFRRRYPDAVLPVELRQLEP